MTVVANYPDYIASLEAEVSRLRETALLRRQLVYLASPYSDPFPEVEAGRFEAACRASANLMATGVFIYSPVAHTHPIHLHGDLPGGWSFWERYDRAILQCCHKMIVLQLPGWEQSKGIAAELEISKELGITVEYMDP